MPSEPDNKVEELVQTYAQKRRDDAGPSFELHPAIRQLLQGDAWKKALESGDVRGLMQNNQLVELIHDPKMGHRLERLAAQVGSPEN